MRTSVRLVASLCVAPLEVDRFLRICVEALEPFCDGIRVHVDGNPETVREALRGTQADVQGQSSSTFWQHEGNTRQAAYEWALQANPTHVLAVDADEVIADGQALRTACETADVIGLCVQEVWAATEQGLTIRMDGGWKPHAAPICWTPRPGWRIPSRASASGRAPLKTIRRWNRHDCATELLHLGWTNKDERAARYARYADAANFGHNAAHIRSIMWADDRITPCFQGWPEGLTPFAAKIVERANRMEVRDGS